MKDESEENTLRLLPVRCPYPTPLDNEDWEAGVVMPSYRYLSQHYRLLLCTKNLFLTEVRSWCIPNHSTDDLEVLSPCVSGTICICKGGHER